MKRYIALLILTAFVLAARVRTAEQFRVKRSEGRFTRDQIFRRSAPVLNALSPGSDKLILSASTTVAFESNGVRHPFWMVEGVSKSRNFQVSVVWEANSGDLFSATHTTPMSGQLSIPELRYCDAVRITSSWLTTLGISDEDNGWRADRPDVHTFGVWQITWRGGKHVVEVEIDSQTGQLILAKQISKW